MVSTMNIQSYMTDSESMFSLLGVVAAAYMGAILISRIYKFMLEHFIGPVLGLSANLKKAGSWAVVTGCTDGIGKAYAQQLAKKGINVVLISRTQAKLDDLAKEIESKYSVKTRTIAVDFTRPDIYEKIEREIQGLEIGTLVNNVGMSLEHPSYFLEITDREKFLMDMINCNMTSVSQMTSLVLPGMEERRRGYIINIASQAAELPCALLTVYSATKVYMDYFSKGIQLEYASKGVTCQVVRPGFVTTKMSGIRRANVMSPSPDTFVKSALSTVGISNSTNGFWVHSIVSFLMRYTPDFVVMKVTNQARLAAIRRKERKKAQQ